MNTLNTYNMKSAMLGEPAYNESFYLARAPPRCPGFLRRSVFLENARKCYVFQWFLKGFRMHCAELKPQTNQRECSPEAFHLVPGSPGTQNVTVANGFC